VGGVGGVWGVSSYTTDSADPGTECLLPRVIIWLHKEWHQVDCTCVTG